MIYLSFLLFLLGFLIIVGFTPEDFTPTPKTTLKERIKRANRAKSNNALVLLYRESKQVLQLQGVENAEVILVASSAALALVGVFLSLLLDNVYIIPAVAGLLAMVPCACIKIYWNRQEQAMHDSLESALNQITTSYLRGNNTFLRSVEENIEQLQNPVQKVFALFLLQTNLIDSNVTEALENMKYSIHHPIFGQWVDTIIRCQGNQTLKTTLPRVLDKFSEQKTVVSEVQLIMAEPKRTYFIMMGASLFAPFLLYFINRDWWNVLLYNSFGKMLLALHLFAVAISLVLGLGAMRISFKEGEEE